MGLSQLNQDRGFDTLIGAHLSMRRIYELIAQVAPTPASVLVTGESGTGKELVARAIHNQSPRKAAPFVAVNLTAIPDGLVESDLFGHEKGAFTGAHKRRLGKFELAHGGTLFLDEIGSLRVHLQVKLLRALQERVVERLGGEQTVNVDVRVVAATNLDLKQAVATGSFRGDLYYRLNVVQIEVPPLRDRREDIPLLVAHFFQKCRAKFARQVTGIVPEALGMLLAYHWPGNVRELENVIERAVVLARGPEIGPQQLPVELRRPENGQGAQQPQTLPETLERIETQLILQAMAETSWNATRAAERLGVPRTTLSHKAKQYGITSPGGPPLGQPS